MKDLDRKHMVEMNGIRSYRQEIYSETINRVGLSGNNDKRLFARIKLIPWHNNNLYYIKYSAL